MSLEDLYQELILDHFRSPRFRGDLPGADARFTIYNPLCGDRVEVALTKSADGIAEVRFAGSGCAISQASASIMSELCRNKSALEVRKLYDKFHAMMRDELPQEMLPELADAAALSGVRRFPARIRCATLAWEALKKCLG